MCTNHTLSSPGDVAQRAARHTQRNIRFCRVLSVHIFRELKLHEAANMAGRRFPLNQTKQHKAAPGACVALANQGASFNWQMKTTPPVMAAAKALSSPKPDDTNPRQSTLCPCIKIGVLTPLLDNCGPPCSTKDFPRIFLSPRKQLHLLKSPAPTTSITSSWPAKLPPTDTSSRP